MAKFTYRHIGFYNDCLDIEELFLETPDSIIILMKEHFGNFYSCEGDRETDIDDIETHPDKNLLEMTTDKEYIVKYQRGSRNKEDWFIDIYQYHELEDTIEQNNSGNITPINLMVHELCPHCDTEVALLGEFKVQKCPKCGKYIVPCNLCPLLAKNKCGGKCPLEELANDLNHEEGVYGTEYSTASFVSLFNSSTKKQWEKGFLVTIFNDDNFIELVLRIFYIQELDTICFMDEQNCGTGWFMKEPKKLSVDYLERVFEIFDIPSNYSLYAKILD